MVDGCKKEGKYHGHTVDIAQLQSQQWSVTFEKRLSEKLRVGMTGQVLTH